MYQCKMNCFKWKPHKGALAYSATAFAAGIMNPVFQFYYVKIFLEKYNIPMHWFHGVQITYMIWNALNDPLFGYCQDNCKLAIVKSRRRAMLYGAPFFAISFLIPWFPWNDYAVNNWLCGIHLLVSLCFYDSMFTYVLLAHGCILAEMTNNHKDRLRMLQYANCAHLVGSVSVFICESFSSHLKNYFYFQITVIILSVFAWAALTYTGKNAHTMYDLQEVEQIVTKNTSELDEQYIRRSDHSIFRLTWQILSNLNFTWFVTMNFMTEVHNSFLVNFCIIITDNLVPKELMPQIFWNIFYGLIMTFPKIVSTIYRPVLSKHGYYNIHRYIFLMKVCSGVFMYLLGSHYVVIFILFILFDGTMSSIAGSMMGLVMTDIIDNDKDVYKRSHPMSSMVFGTNALVTKPAQSLAPMITVAILNKFGYEQYKAGNLQDTESLKTCMFTMACFMPVIVGAIQYFAWTRYKIRNSHIIQVKYVEG